MRFIRKKTVKKNDVNHLEMANVFNEVTMKCRIKNKIWNKKAHSVWYNKILTPRSRSKDVVWEFNDEDSRESFDYGEVRSSFDKVRESFDKARDSMLSVEEYHEKNKMASRLVYGVGMVLVTAIAL